MRPSASSSGLCFGYNSNICYLGRLFHIQTEDSGVSKGHIYTHLYCGGVILASEKVDYDHQDHDQDHDTQASEHILELMKRSHRAMLRRLCHGELNARIDKLPRVLGNA